MADPVYIAQTADPKSQAEREAWWQSTMQEGRQKGATFFRVSVHPAIDHLILTEGWERRPTDQGLPRFALESRP